MRHRNKNRKLKRTKAAREAMLNNLAADLILHDRIRTNRAKGKEVKSLAERYITLGITGKESCRRQLVRVLPNRRAVKRVTSVLKERYSQRKSGFVRLMYLGTKKGDAAKVVLLELVDLAQGKKKKKKLPKK